MRAKAAVSRRIVPRLPAALALAAALAASAALGEGARKVLDCTIVRSCDGRGSCAAASGSVVFRLEPLKVEVGRSGRYSVEYDGARAEAEAYTDIGPFLWTVGDERHSLLASSESEWLWHRLGLAAAPAATIRFLSCSFQQ